MITPPAEVEPAVPVLEMADAAIASLHVPDAILVDHVQWKVLAGEYWVIGGASASGKSDLLTTAAGLMRPVRGEVRLFGQRLALLPESDRLRLQLRVGIVFGHGGRLFNHLSLGENLSLPLCYHQNCVPAATHQRVQTVLESMELASVVDLTPMAASRNIRQRVALARALVLSPRLLFLDNPLVGVDPRETRWWLEFLDALVRGHPLLGGCPLTIVAGTDDFQPWASHGSHFGLIDRGQLAVLGTWDDVQRHTNPALRELLPLDSLES